MGQFNRLSAFWISAALASVVSCSINPQPEPPGLDAPKGTENVGGATSANAAAGGGFNIAFGGAMNAGGMQSPGTGNSGDWTKGGSSSGNASDDGGLRGDASSGSDSGTSVGATPDASSSGLPSAGSQRR